MYTILLGGENGLINNEDPNQNFISCGSKDLAKWLSQINELSYNSKNEPNVDMVRLYMRPLEKAPIIKIALHHGALSERLDFTYLTSFNKETVRTIHFDTPGKVDGNALVKILKQFTHLEELLIAQMTFDPRSISNESKEYFAQLYLNGVIKPYGSEESFVKLLGAFGINHTRAAPVESMPIVPVLNVGTLPENLDVLTLGGGAQEGLGSGLSFPASSSQNPSGNFQATVLAGIEEEENEENEEADVGFGAPVPGERKSKNVD